MSTTTRRATASVLGAVALAGTAFAGAGTGTATASPSDTKATSSSSSGKTAWLTFDKNWSNPTNSQLRLSIVRNGKAIKTLKWRSGSGLGNTNECASSKGWLPNGRYDVRMFGNHQGSIVKGRAFQLDDKTCKSGSTTRTELFIHTSKPWSTSRYKSLGCVKLTPSHIETMYDTLRYHFPKVGEGEKLPFQLKVTS